MNIRPINFTGIYFDKESTRKEFVKTNTQDDLVAWGAVLGDKTDAFVSQVLDLDGEKRFKIDTLVRNNKNIVYNQSYKII